MKILTNNFKPAVITYPYDYICQVCSSKLQIESANDIHSDITVQSPTSKNSSATEQAKGFICPACGGVNITG